MSDTTRPDTKIAGAGDVSGGIYGSACTLGWGCLGFGFVGSCCCQCFVGFLTVCHR